MVVQLLSESSSRYYKKSTRSYDTSDNPLGVPSANPVEWICVLKTEYISILTHSPRRTKRRKVVCYTFQRTAYDAIMYARIKLKCEVSMLDVNRYKI